MKQITSLAIAATITLSSAGVAFGYAGQQYAAKAHVSLAQARAIATKTVTGTIAAQELEMEKGGSGLRYSFDIKTARGIREVGVDAETGSVLENSVDAPAKSAKGTKDAPDKDDVETNDAPGK